MQYIKHPLGWLFTYGTGEGAQTYLAVKNDAGFAHRNWEVWTIKVTARGIEQDRCIEDQMPSRESCLTPALIRYRNWKDAR